MFLDTATLRDLEIVPTPMTRGMTLWSMVDRTRTRRGQEAPILGDSRIALFQFTADVTADQPRFDYRLRDGVSAQRLGMTLLRQEGVLDLLERSAQSSDVQPNHADVTSAIRTPLPEHYADPTQD